ncbi:MAG: ArsA family ATPase [Desulfobacterales bacterium]|nr:ArsA family ATPase [Desulfobacterales bacterium]
MTNMVPEYFQNKELRLILFGGKGGVGKTTMAAAAAVHLAQSYCNKKKVLVISTDPAHSLGDSFGIELGDEVTSVDSGQWSVDSGQWSVTSNEQQPVTNDQCPMTNLYARELDAVKLGNRFKRKNEDVIKKLADRGTYFDRQDITEFFNLSLPGMDEVMAVIEIANIFKEGIYDILIVDTAPTGHTVRMLSLPEQMLRWIEFMDLMQQKHRFMSVQFSGKSYVKDECDFFIDKLTSDIEKVKKLLSDRQTTRFVPVTIPEPMATSETKRLLSALKKNNIPVTEIIVNRVADAHGCAFCAAKQEDQRQSLSEIEESFSQSNLIKVPLFPREIRGVEELKGLADYLMGISRPHELPKAVVSIEETQACLALDPNLEFVLFGGKGGVGKTSIASAAALHLARCNPDKNILIFCTDPAHSLSDSFKLTIGDKITPIEWSVDSGQWAVDRAQSPVTNDQCPTTNLFALEINADKLFEDFKQDFKKEIEEIFDKFLGGRIDIKFDREVMMELLTLAPPGLDEIMALDKIMDLRKEGKFDIFILDTSPTGHLIRFLELPEMVREWLNAFFRLLLKYKGVVRLAKAAEKALAMSKNVRRIQEAFIDSKRTSFVSVTIAEAMGLLELERLVSALDNAKINCGGIIVNMVNTPLSPPSRWDLGGCCNFCSSKRVEQAGYIRKIHSIFPSRTITNVPMFPHEVRGIDDLNKIGEIIFGNREF